MGKIFRPLAPEKVIVDPNADQQISQHEKPGYPF